MLVFNPATTKMRHSCSSSNWNKGYNYDNYLGTISNCPNDLLKIKFWCVVCRLRAAASTENFSEMQILDYTPDLMNQNFWRGWGHRNLCFNKHSRWILNAKRSIVLVEALEQCNWSKCFLNPACFPDPGTDLA